MHVRVCMYVHMCSMREHVCVCVCKFVTQDFIPTMCMGVSVCAGVCVYVTVSL